MEITVEESDVVKLLQDNDYLVFKREDDIPDYIIERQAQDRGLTDDKELGDFGTSEVIDHLECMGYEVVGADDSYSDNALRSNLESLYYKRLHGIDITEDINELILEAAGRIV